MSAVPKAGELRSDAESLLKRLPNASANDIKEIKVEVEKQRNARHYELMGKLVEAVSRHDPDDVKNRRLYGQYLIEIGSATAAIDVLKALLGKLKADHPEYAEAMGLLGRANKQIFLEFADKSDLSAHKALKAAIRAYGAPYKANDKSTWHGINLLALCCYANRLGIPIGRELDSQEIARKIIVTLQASAPSTRDDWFLPTLAEAYLGLGDWDAVEKTVGTYVASPKVNPFLVAGTLRQFVDVWNLDGPDQRGRSIVAALRARLLELEGHDLQVDPRSVKAMQTFEPETSTLEAILGDDGPKKYRWMQEGMRRALAVASIKLRFSDRRGTGFLVRAGDFGLSPAEELLVLTNWHVVNPEGVHSGVRPETAEVVFEAMDPPSSFSVQEIAWLSPVQLHDATLLRLNGDPPKIAPMTLAANLPAVTKTARVYVVGYSGGGELSLSLQDNSLLDHEGPAAGKPRIPGVCRVHYRAPTEPGSSGSPVFDGDLWHVVALHHAGSKYPVNMLNEKAGTYLANEGISIGSIKDAITANAARVA